MIDEAQLQPWEQRDDESGPAWDGFSLFRDQGSTRKLVEVSRMLGKSESLIGRWAAQYDWWERALAFDREADRLRWERDQTERAKARRAMLMEHARFGQSLWRRVATRLVDESTEDSSRVVALESMSVRDLAVLARLGLETEARARGQSKSRIGSRTATLFSNDVIQVAMDFVPPESQDAFLATMDAKLASLG